MSIFQEKATVQRLEHISEDNYLLTLHSPQIAQTAEPGQFVMVGLGVGKDPLLRRPFSLNQIKEDGRIRILFKVVGRGTQLLAHSCEGDVLPVLGPLGNGYDIDPEKPACLIGGGMGIAPLLFVAEYLNAIENREMDDIIILGGRNRDELQPLVDDFSRLGMNLFTATDDGSYGIHGLVTDVLASVAPSSDYVVYSCGPKPMLYAVYQSLQEKEITCQVSIESVMACGMGACLGCSVPAPDGSFVHVCTDGPVFKADELAWE